MRIVMTCQGNDHHTQEIEVDHMTTLDAEVFAGVLDGTSPFFVVERQDTPSGGTCRCRSCDSLFDAVVQD